MTTAEDITRRVAIENYKILDASPATDLESLVHLAAQICGVPTAVINIIDDRFQHQVAAVGMSPAACSRDDSMCAVVFQHPGHVVVPDARLDPRFATNPFVTGEIANVRFYASSPLVTPDGIPIGTLCVFDDVPREMSTESSDALLMLAHQVVDVLELRRITYELGQSNEQLASFAGQLSHDLRNPLMAVSGFLELATDSPEMVNAPQAAKALARAESAADRMATMITDLLSYARIDGAKPRHEPVGIRYLIDQVAEDLHSPIEESGAVVTVSSDATVQGDPTLLRALLQNLVANAIKFSQASGVAPLIEVSVLQVSSGWRITVDDNGPGIAEDQREKVFDLMDRGNAHDVAGLGIGLSTCRRIVLAHGGQIGIEESPLGGARIWVRLPSELG